MTTDIKTAKNILSVICSANGHVLTYSEAKEAIETIQDTRAIADINHVETDFILELDGAEYRIIEDDDLWDIYVETIKDIVQDCYELKLDDIPDFVAFAIDWEGTAKNCLVDGYGHTLSGYDGSELETGGYHIFRTN